MNRYIQLCAIALMGLLVACKPTTPEVVEADYSYAIDKKKVEVETPKPYIFDDATYAFIDKKAQEVYFFITSYSDGTQQIEGDNPVTVEVQLSTPAKEEIVLKLGVSSKKTQALLESNTAFQQLPTEVLSYQQEVRFAPGARKATVQLSLQNDKLAQLVLNQRYSLVFELSAVSGSGYKFARDHNEIRLTVLASRDLFEGENITYQKKLPANLTQYPKEKISPSSATNPEKIGAMFDGKTVFGDYWSMDPSEGEPLTLKFEELTKVKAIRIYGRVSKSDPAYILYLSMKASNDGGLTFAEQGSVLIEEQINPLILVFEKAIEVDMLTLYSFYGWNKDIKIFEMEVFAEK